MNKKRKSQKLLPVLLSAVILFSALPMCASAENLVISNEAAETNVPLKSIATVSDTENIYNKIHFYFGDSDNSTIDDMSELVEATSKLNNRTDLATAQNISIAASEEVKITVQFESGFMDTDEYKAFEKERAEINTIDEVHEFRERLNSFSKEYHAAILSDNISTLCNLDYNSIIPIEYSPFAIVTIDTDKITADALFLTATSNDIVSISVATLDQPESATSWDDALKGINAYDIVNSKNSTGKGIYVGIYEAEGICDLSNVNLSNKNIERYSDSEAISDHATIVTSVLATIAPDASFFVRKYDSAQFGLQWFIDKGCDIVNCSFNFPVSSMEYRSDIDGIYDYQVRAHFITVVVSAGNYNSSGNPDKKVTSPGHAYNVITVGGVKEVSSSATSHRLEHADNACYQSSTPSVKPNISAFYTVDIPNIGAKSGTSFAAPQVAGCIALLEEGNPILCLYPEHVLSLITSTAQMTNDYVQDIGYFNNKVGAGVLDLQGMMDVYNSVNKYSQTVTTTGSGNSVIARIDVTLQKGDNLQAGLAWLVNTSKSTNSASYNACVSDYNLTIYSPSGVPISSTLTDSNVELIRLTATASGNYRIVISRNGPIAGGATSDRLYLTYHIT